MGLRDYKKYKKENELKNSEIISNLLKRIEVLEKKVGEMESQRFVKTPEKDQQKIEALKNKTKPEDFIKLFTDDLEEFDPNA